MSINCLKEILIKRGEEIKNKKFATAINCMDGRTQIPVNEWLKKEFGADYIDTITEAGPNKILAEGKESSTLVSIKKRLDISVNKHSSNNIAVVGHYDCAGNPVEKSIQLEHIKLAIKTIESWKFNAQVIGLWVDDNWDVYRV